MAAKPRPSNARKPLSRRRVAWVAGATGGLGSAIARRLAEAGYDLVLSHRSRPAEARALALEAARCGVKTLVCAGDLLDAAFVDRAVNAVRRAFGRLDALILSVGDLHLGPASRTSPGDLGRQLRSNVHAPWALALGALPLLEKSSPSTIVFFGMAGTSSSTGKRQTAAHAASKAALLVLARSLARELAPKRITVLTVAPGVVKTARSSRAAVEPFRRAIPSGHVNTPEEVADVVLFAVSPAARPLTGAEIPVANGFGL
jgi:3-oxoacyl-[acyl-carrier protein] reductase